jgi:ABC-type glycerol-3-phosphate transport system substrate-binding protein
MRKILGLCAAALLCTTLAAGAAQAGKSRQAAVVNLTFATYVWQPTTVAATKSIVEAWNRANPNIQVQIVPVDVNSVHDKLLTSFVGGTAADIVHDEAADIPGFTAQGYLANLRPLLPKSLKDSIPKKLWDTTTFGSRGITGVPLLMQTYNIFANMTILKQARVKAPTVEKPWTWTNFRAVAKNLTKEGQYGVCAGLRSPTALLNTVSMNWGGHWFYLENGKWEFKFGTAERRAVQTIHDMIHVDKSMDPAAPASSGSAALPAFFGGRCAMTIQGNFQAQGMISQSPRGFNWAMFPPLKGSTQDQAANPQTLSISQQSTHKREAMQFIAYVLRAQNIAKLAAGDWLIPSVPAAGKVIRASTKHAGSWRVATASVPHLVKANWVSLTPYARWKAEYAQSNFVQYLSNRISIDDLGSRLESGWKNVRG